MPLRRQRRRLGLILGLGFGLGLGLGFGLTLGLPRRALAQAAADADRGFAELAAEMKRRALGWGDQPYGAVLVLDGKLVGEGPSRVVQRGDPTAHAEREAIRDAQRRLGRQRLDGSVLYSTSRPCAACEAAAFEAGVARMRHGPDARDAGAPQAR